MAKKKASAPVTYPIQHWSKSSMMDFLTNPIIFKKRWVAGVYDDDTSMNGMLGRAAHHALATIFGGNVKIPVPPETEKAVPIGMQAGLDYLDKIPDGVIRYGKTGSRELLLQKYTKAMTWYTSEMPEWEIVSVEEKMQEFLTAEDGTEFAIPMKGLTDLLVRKENGRLRIIDHKFVTSYTEPDEENASYIIQSMFLYHLVKKAHGEAPEDIIFRECKTSENKDGTVQTKEWGIVFDKVPHYFTFFYKLYSDCTRAITREDAIYLPNFGDYLNGAQAFLLYQQNLIEVDMSDIQIDHATHHVRYMPKTEAFKDSVLNTVDSAQYLPQERIRVKLGEFGVPVKAESVYNGAAVTLYTFAPSRGVSIGRVEKHIKDIALSLGVESIRLVAPIPNTNLIGIEAPKQDRDTIEFSDSLLEQGSFQIPIGVDVYGKIVKKDLRKMPHLLVAGATGSGKSVFMNVVIRSLVSQQTPEKLELVLVDPKQVELSHWENDPHTKAFHTGVMDTLSELRRLTVLMDERYKTLKGAGAKSIEKYGGKMPYIVVVIDEFADLIMSTEKMVTRDMISGKKVDQIVAGKEVEHYVVRLAQKGRAAGIHLVIGTQRPSVNVLTGLIKANMPTRAAFMCTSRTESQIILDQNGAEDLLGAGDMLFLDPSEKGVRRLQGFFAE